MEATDAGLAGDQETSIFQSNLPLETKLERARTELLDLSARHLTSMFRAPAKALERHCQGNREYFFGAGRLGQLLRRNPRALSETVP